MQAVLLARAFEESDSEHQLLSRGERQSASKSAQDVSFDGFLVRRAAPLVEVLEREIAMLPRLRRAVRLRFALAWLLLPALLLGLLSNLLGPEKRINVVANPLSGLILWNLAIYVLIFFGFILRLFSRGNTNETRERFQPSLGLATRWASWPARSAGREMSGDRPGRRALFASGTARFLELWNQTSRPLLSARVRLCLHWAAAIAVVGALAGMYVRGLVFEYQASWESTFLTAEQVQFLLDKLFAPATFVSGLETPDVSAIGSGASHERAGGAARWIHLYAVTTGLFVLLPRGILGLSAYLRARRLRNALPLATDASYYQRLQTSGGGGEVHARVLPYSYALSPTRADRLKATLHDVLGARARITIEESIAYGELPNELDDPARVDKAQGNESSSAGYLILLFNLSQTPESEVHGELVEKLKQGTQKGGKALVLLDASAWRERSGATPAFEKRLAEHRRTWDRVVRDAGLRACHLELDVPPTDELVAELEAGIHPPRLVASERS